MAGRPKRRARLNAERRARLNSYVPTYDVTVYIGGDRQADLREVPIHELPRAIAKQLVTGAAPGTYEYGMFFGPGRKVRPYAIGEDREGFGYAAILKSNYEGYRS